VFGIKIRRVLRGDGLGSVPNPTTPMPHILIFGLGCTATRIAAALAAKGWGVVPTGSTDTVRFDDTASIRLALAQATHILSSVPPVADGGPVLNAYGDLIGQSLARWIGYLSSTGVYGDAGAARVDESAPLRGRRGNQPKGLQ
jgi:hypothetical protein